jgi:uncharacterized protein
MSLTADQVADYLRAHTGFFEENVALLTDIQVPHPHGGRAISLSERQMLALRDKNRVLEAKLAELIQFGEENDAIGEKLHALALALIRARGFDEVLAVIYGSLLDGFGVPHAAIRLWDMDLAAGARPEAEPIAAELREFAGAMTAPYCGSHAIYEVGRWFGDQAPHLRSFAAIPLHVAGRCVGLLVLASEDARRFYPEMGTLYLRRLGELASTGLAACA